MGRRSERRATAQSPRGSAVASESAGWLCVPELYEQAVHVEVGVTTDDLAVRVEVVDLTIRKFDRAIGRRHRPERSIVGAPTDELRDDGVACVVIPALGDL